MPDSLSPSVSSTDRTGSAVEPLEDQAGLLADDIEQALRLTGASAEALAGIGGPARHLLDAASAIAERVPALQAAGDGSGQRLMAAAGSVERMQGALAELRSTLGAVDQAAAGLAAASRRIAELAERVDLVALNAAIEAVRAGAAGKGFAVVAAEVQVLSAETVKAADALAGHEQALRAALREAQPALDGSEQLALSLGDDVAGAAAALQTQTNDLGVLRRDADTAAATGRGLIAGCAGAVEAANAAAARIADALALSRTLLRSAASLRPAQRR